MAANHANKLFFALRAFLNINFINDPLIIINARFARKKLIFN